jgi:hypothetical protein
MRSLTRRAAVVAGAVVVLLGPAAGVASASGTVALIWSPTTSTGTYNYGTLIPGQTASQTFTLINSGSASTAALKVTLTGSSAFTKTGDTCGGAKLKPNKSCYVIVQYGPTTSGQTDSATLTATSSKPSATASLTLKGASAKASPAIATSPSTGGTVGRITVKDTASLSGGSSPGGSIEFKLYGPSTSASCSGTPVDDETVTVSGNGTYTTPTGATPSQAGTYWWTANYGGDTANNAAASGCGAESVAISKASPVLATAPSAGGTVGTTVTDTAALAGGYNPTGKIEFKAYGPSATADCSGTPVDDETVTVTDDGTYTTPQGFTPSQAGTYWWTASYGGDSNNTPVASGCDQESVTITPASPAIATSPNASGTGTVGSTTVTDTATLSGGYNPTGTIEFQLYSDPNCSTRVDDETVTVTGDGSYTTPQGFTPTQAGTYWWTASYNGDAANNPAASNCGDESVTIAKASPAILTSATQGGTVGTPVRDTAHLTGSDNATGTIEFQLYGPSATADCSGTPVDDETVTVNGDGYYPTPAGFTPTQDGTYWWTASYNGDSNNDPAASGCGDESLTVGPHLYWTDFSIGRVIEANLDGSSPAFLATGGGLRGVAVNSSNLYWADGGAILETNLNGTSGLQVVVSFPPTVIGVAVNNSNLYWSGGGQIWEANLNGFDQHPIVFNQNFPAGVAVNGSDLYWADQSSGQIWEANLDGTNAHAIVFNQFLPAGVAVNGSDLYWADQSSGQIWEANLDGSNPHPVVFGQNQPSGVAVNNSNLYWSNQGDGTIWEANLGGGDVQVIFHSAEPLFMAVGP